MKPQLIVSNEELVNTFEQLCNKYQNLSMAVAWCGKPDSSNAPYCYLKKVTINAIIGIDFTHSHPEGIEMLRKLSDSLFILNTKDGNSVFHPKTYLFENKKDFALMVGSANFTNGGFGNNEEAMILIEGTKYDLKNIYYRYKVAFKNWQKSAKSFNEIWFNNYTEEYKKNKKRFDKYKKLTTPIAVDNKILPLTELQKLDWESFYIKIKDKISNERRFVLNKKEEKLRFPLRMEIFKDKEIRKLLWGQKDTDYATFGNVGASTYFKGLLNSGSVNNKKTIISILNEIHEYKFPNDYQKLESNLKQLCKIKHKEVSFSMKCWGRLLLLTRPDLFLTVSNNEVRKKIASELTISKMSLASPAGYIKALKKIHPSKWFISSKPKNMQERFIWENRVALLDVIFSRW